MDHVKESFSGSIMLIDEINLTFSSIDISSVILNSGPSSTLLIVSWTFWVVVLKPSSAKTMSSYTLSAFESVGFSKFAPPEYLRTFSTTTKLVASSPETPTVRVLFSGSLTVN